MTPYLTYGCMDEVLIRNALRTDLPEFARQLRKADRQEAWSMLKQGPLHSLNTCFRSSWRCRGAWDREGRPVCLYGCGTDGTIWMVATERLRAHAKTLYRLFPQEILQVSQGCTFVHNKVDSRNTLHIHWLLKMGFEFPFKFAFHSWDGTPYLYFRKDLRHVRQ